MGKPAACRGSADGDRPLRGSADGWLVHPLDWAGRLATLVGWLGLRIGCGLTVSENDRIAAALPGREGWATLRGSIAAARARLVGGPLSLENLPYHERPLTT
jgi:hypothetical protein